MSNLIPTESEINLLTKIGNMAIKSGYLPASIKNPEQAIIIALKGKELGIPPLQAFAQIAVVNGKPTMSAELMQALIFKNVPTAEIAFTENSNEKCVIKARRSANQEYSVFSFTMDDAKNAGLLGKQVWKQYPSAMLKARCISSMARALFADAIMGVSYVAEELGAEVDEDGAIIESKSVITENKQTDKKEKIVEAEIVGEDKLNHLQSALNYKLTFSKQSGRTIGEILDKEGLEFLSNLAASVKDFYDKAKKPLPQNATDFIMNVELIEMNKSELK